MPPNPISPPTLRSLSPAIQGVLSRLRSRIRWWVVCEGIATATAWLSLAFWAALAIDYLPVRFGWSELNRNSRIAILLLAIALIATVLYRLVFRRVFVRMTNGSMAMLIERKYPQFGDSLLTTVSRTKSHSIEDLGDRSMLERTRLDAESHLGDVDLAQVVNSAPLRRSLIIAGALLVSVVGLGIVKPGVLQIAAQRLVLLQSRTWPRQCQLEMVGIRVIRDNPIEAIDEFGQFLLPTNGEFRIAKGSTLTMMVQAKGPTEGGERRLPENCSLIYRTDDGQRGVQAFKRIGAPRDGYQLYSLDGQPLRGVLNDITFDVLGGDFRLGPFKLAVVDEPFVFETELALKYPSYIVDEASGSWTDRTIPWTGQALLPEGTAVTILAKSEKELTKVYAWDQTHQKMNIIEANGNAFRFAIPRLHEAVSVQFYLCDTDGLVAEQPHTVSLEPIEDQPPIVETRLTGIGTAVTPDVQIPISGSVVDDYGLKRTWIEIDITGSPRVAELVEIGAESELEAIVDFKRQRQGTGSQYELPVGDQTTVQLMVRSEDNCDLRDLPNVGIGDSYTLDIVTPNQLLMILERLEVGQRRRLEQIYIEMMDARKYLIRAKSQVWASENDLIEPGDSANQVAETGDGSTGGGGQSAIRKHELRLLFTQRALLQADKSTQEILGSAEAFENIRLQLINNRIDSEDRKIRISDQIIAPLRLIADKSMRQLKRRIGELESNLRDLQISPQDEQVSQNADQLAKASIEQLDIALNQLDLVLEALVKYETQNELLEIVRQIIQNQQDLMERTKKERQRKAFEGLLD